QSELATVVKPRRSVHDHTGRVDLTPPPVRMCWIPREDRLGVTRAVLRDVGERSLDAIDHTDREDRVQELAAPVLGRRRLGRWDEQTGPLATTKLTPG